jgi:hypothetical protein
VVAFMENGRVQYAPIFSGQRKCLGNWDVHILNQVLINF